MWLFGSVEGASSLATASTQHTESAAQRHSIFSGCFFGQHRQYPSGYGRNKSSELMRACEILAGGFRSIFNRELTHSCQAWASDHTWLSVILNNYCPQERTEASSFKLWLRMYGSEPHSPAHAYDGSILPSAFYLTVKKTLYWLNVAITLWMQFLQGFNFMMWHCELTKIGRKWKHVLLS